MASEFSSGFSTSISQVWQFSTELLYRIFLTFLFQFLPFSRFHQGRRFHFLTKELYDDDNDDEDDDNDEDDDGEINFAIAQKPCRFGRKSHQVRRKIPSGRALPFLLHRNKITCIQRFLIWILSGHFWSSFRKTFFAVVGTWRKNWKIWNTALYIFLPQALRPQMYIIFSNWQICYISTVDPSNGVHPLSCDYCCLLPNMASAQRHTVFRRLVPLPVKLGFPFPDHILHISCHFVDPLQLLWRWRNTGKR